MLSGTTVSVRDRPRAGKKIQNKAVRIVTGATKLTLLKSLSLKKLVGRVFLLEEKKFLQNANGMTPEYLSSLAPPTVGSMTRYTGGMRNV